MSKLSEIKGIVGYESKLEAVEIKTVEKLLEECSTKKSRKELADKTGISEKLILEWANRADLSRVKGIGVEYSDLLEASGVDTVPELANRKPENLLKKMEEVNAEQSLVKQLPALKRVEDWVEQASSLPRILTY